MGKMNHPRISAPMNPSRKKAPPFIQLPRSSQWGIKSARNVGWMPLGLSEERAGFSMVIRLIRGFDIGYPGKIDCGYLPTGRGFVKGKKPLNLLG
jgi:hypothetical protein